MPTRVTIQQIFNSPSDDITEATKDAQSGALKPISVTVSAQVQAAPKAPVAAPAAVPATLPPTTLTQMAAPAPTATVEKVPAIPA